MHRRSRGAAQRADGASSCAPPCCSRTRPLSATTARRSMLYECRTYPLRSWRAFRARGFIFSHESAAIHLWDTLLMVLIVYVAVYTPLVFVFGEESTTALVSGLLALPSHGVTIADDLSTVLAWWRWALPTLSPYEAVSSDWRGGEACS